jgi:hypothetical protein
LSKNEKEAQEKRAENYQRSEWYAENFPSLEPLKDFTDIQKKVRKEMGLEP